METSAVATTSYQPERKPAEQQSLGQQDFLRLMVTQFQNQDPFQPLESGEFLGQIAQFSTVAGISDLNTAFAELSASVGNNQALQGAALVGLEALVAADNIEGGGGQSISGQVSLDAPGELVLEISNASGELVRSINYGQQDSGEMRVNWDGNNHEGEAAPEGQYQIAARITAGGATYSTPVLLQGRIDSISLGGASGAAFNVTGIGPVSLSDIRQIQ